MLTTTHVDPNILGFYRPRVSEAGSYISSGVLLTPNHEALAPKSAKWSANDPRKWRRFETLNPAP